MEPDSMIGFVWNMFLFITTISVTVIVIGLYIYLAYQTVVYIIKYIKDKQEGD